MLAIQLRLLVIETSTVKNLVDRPPAKITPHYPKSGILAISKTGHSPVFLMISGRSPPAAGQAGLFTAGAQRRRETSGKQGLATRERERGLIRDEGLGIGD
jgi:hypothetical protein